MAAQVGFSNVIELNCFQLLLKPIRVVDCYRFGVEFPVVSSKLNIKEEKIVKPKKNNKIKREGEKKDLLQD